MLLEDIPTKDSFSSYIDFYNVNQNLVNMKLAGSFACKALEDMQTNFHMAFYDGVPIHIIC
jgi:hypothetical protein